MATHAFERWQYDTVTTWPAPTPSTEVVATVNVPGSKSQTNRALVLSALAAARGQGNSELVGALRSRDTDLMLDALRALGLHVDARADRVTIGGSLNPAPNTQLDCGLAGTVLRFVPPLAALSDATVTFDGDEQARVRPIAPLLDAMRGLGIDVDGAGLPFSIHGTGRVNGGTVEIDASASSQFVSGLLLSAAAFDTGLTVVHTGKTLPSAPHIAMTVAMLRQGGIDVDDTTANVWHVAPSVAAARHWTIEPDLSNATPFLAAAVVTGGCVRIAHWPCAGVQPSSAIIDILRATGATVSHAEDHLCVQGTAGYPGFEVNLRDVGELTPTVAALAALATPGSVSHLSGIAHLRGHETDRLAALTTEINRLGGRVVQNPDGLEITATELHAGTWHSYADHRMATAGAILGLRVAGIEVDDIETTAKTLPDFPQMWATMLADTGTGT